MTLVQLRHFVVVADLGSFVQASKALYLTQPALTRSIRSLEEELGGILFDRVGRRISLTQFGAQVLQRARQLVLEAEALKQTSSNLQAGLSGKLRIGLSSAPGALLSVPLMLHVAQHHPRLKLEIARGSTHVLLGQLRDQALDAAVVDLRSMRPSSQVQVVQSFGLRGGFLVRPDHPLTRLGRPVSLSEVLAFPVASTPLSDEVARFLSARYGAEANPEDMVSLRCDETLSLVEVARRSDVIVLTVHGVAADLVQLDVLPDAGANSAPEGGARFGLVTLGRRQQAPALRILRDWLEEWTATIHSQGADARAP